MNKNSKKTAEYEEIVDSLQFQNRAIRRYCKKHQCNIDDAIKVLYGKGNK